MGIKPKKKLKRSKEWEQYLWPDYVPADVREKIVDFYSSQSGRSPEDYKGIHHQPNVQHPQPGIRVYCESIGGDRSYRGRWIPAWNNIGFVVLNDGKWAWLSTCAIRVI